MAGPHRSGRRFALQVVLPIGALLGATLAVLLAVVAWTALEQNRYAVASSRRLADNALAVVRDGMVRAVVDYAFWDDAVRHLVLALDEDWAEENLAWLRSTLGAELVLVVDASGRIVYGLAGGGRVSGPADARLAGGLEGLLQAARGRVGEAVTGLLDAGGTPVLAAAAAVRPYTAAVRLPEDLPSHVLVAVEHLDAARLREMGELHLLRDLRLAGPAEGGEGGGVLPLTTVDGTELGSLAWLPDRPGTELLWRLGPALAALSLGLALAAALVLRHARQAAMVIRLTEERAATDALTGLPNRVLLRDRIGQGLARLRREGGRLALLYLDLDGFKPVNDIHGHAAGDMLLRLVADRLRGCVRESDTLARIGGDEFVILLAEPATAEAATACAKRASAAMARPFPIGAGTAIVGVSIGIATATAATPDPDALLRAADRALYRAKHDGRGTWRLADEAWEPVIPGVAPASGVAEA